MTHGELSNAMDAVESAASAYEALREIYGESAERTRFAQKMLSQRQAELFHELMGSTPLALEEADRHYRDQLKDQYDHSAVSEKVAEVIERKRLCKACYAPTPQYRREEGGEGRWLCTRKGCTSRYTWTSEE